MDRDRYERGLKKLEEVDGEAKEVFKERDEKGRS